MCFHGKYEIHRSLLTRWKKEAIEGLPGILSTAKKKGNDDQKLIEVLYQKIGQLKVENDWLNAHDKEFLSPPSMKMETEHVICFFSYILVFSHLSAIILQFSESIFMVKLKQFVPDRKHLIDMGHPDISINKQCELLQVSKGALYY